jgi:UDP-2-acetamido-2-deoxy-ribo-hexuluronate aminotransferase
MDVVFAHGQFIMGPEVEELEKNLASYVGVEHCISASSGTDTLLIALMALGIKPGDEVITTPFSFVANAEMISLLGATPIFVDIDLSTYNIDSTKIEAAITPRTRALLPVSLFGQCAEMTEINAIATKYKLPVIEDAAQSFGATYKGTKSCALSDIGSTSFFPSKPLGAYGDGGALFTNDDGLAKSMRTIRAHGQTSRYRHTRVGINGRLDTLQAAILLAKLERFEWEIEQRHKKGLYYSQLLAQKCPNVVTPKISKDRTSVYAQYSVLVRDRVRVVKELTALGIPTAVHYPSPLNQQTPYLCAAAVELTPIADDVSKRILSLPMGPDLTESDQIKVVEALASLNRS